jgi:ankyrin repeat protein
MTALMWAANWGLADCAKALLANGADPNVRGRRSKTALMCGVGSEKGPGCAKALIAAGADVNAKSAEGETALMKAAASANGLEWIKALIAAGADVNAKNARNETALTLAVSGEMAALLRAAGGADRRGSGSAIPPAKKSLSPSQSCAIHYFSSPKERDEAYRILASEFGSRFQHIERRSTSRMVIYRDWIVVGDTNAYQIWMQRALKEAGCAEEEIQYVDYRTVLADSSEVAPTSG